MIGVGNVLVKDGRKYVIINGVEYELNHPAIVKNYLNPKQYLHVHYARELIVDINCGVSISSSVKYKVFSSWKRGFFPDNDQLIDSLPYIEVHVGHNRRPVKVYNIMPSKLIKRCELLEGTNNPGVYYFPLDLEVLDKKMAYRQFNNIYKKRKVEDILGPNPNTSTKEYQELKAAIFKENVKWGVDSSTHIELEGLKPTLGFEIETVSGTLTQEESQNLNVSAVHDGSLRGPNGEEPEGGEYVTGVLYGDAGFSHLHEICRVLTNKCKIDHRAGVHVHIGSLDWNKEDIVYCYLLAEMIEKEMYSMLPKSRLKNSYCRPLTPIIKDHFLPLLNRTFSSSKEEYDVIVDTAYDEIFKETSGGHLPSKSVNSNSNHPRGSKCGYDKKAQRYCWLNFVTLIFDTKGNPNSKTLEIRSHSATLNYKKIKNWTKIWVAFTNFVNKYKSSIIKGYHTDAKGNKYNITLELMCKLAYPKRGNQLIDYIRERKQVFKTADESVDYVNEVTTKKSIKECVLS